MSTPLDQSQTSAPATTTTVQAASWGHTADGRAVDLYTLDNGRLRVTISSFGATVVNLFAPDREGHLADVVLGYKTPGEYEHDVQTYFGATIGRFANRIANGAFFLDGERFHVPQNNGDNALHGGPSGFDKHLWTARIIDAGVEMTLHSEDDEMGFPGALDTQVRFTLDGGTLLIEYTAVTTKPTIINLTNHSYFNLAGEASGTVLNHRVRVNADRYTPINHMLIPTGELATVEGTPFDLREPHALGAGLAQTHPQLEIARGYDHNFVLRAAESNALAVAAEVQDPASGRVLTVETTEPGVQLYSGNFLDGSAVGKGGVAYVQHAGFCLETQHFPDSPNHANFPSTRLTPGETFRSATRFSFR